MLRQAMLPSYRSAAIVPQLSFRSYRSLGPSFSGDAIQIMSAAKQ